jgi:hypothetical protein
MPSKSKKQHNFMAAIAHNPAFAKKVGIPQSVGKEFNDADKGKKFGTGGNVGYTYGGKGQINKQRTRYGSTFGVENNIPNVNINKYIGKKEGGLMKHDDMKQDMPMMKKVAKQEVKAHEKSMHKMAKGGTASARADGCAVKGKTKGTMISMCGGGYMKKGK